jgi:hypothetical protein
VLFFCTANERRHHLFLFDCHVADSFGIPYTLVLAFNHLAMYLASKVFFFAFKLRVNILVGARALCWTIWFGRNDLVFNRTTTNSSCRLFLGGNLFDMKLIAVLFREEERDVL